MSVRLHLGCGRTILPDWINLDSVSLPGVDIIADLDCCAQTPLPLADDSIDEFLLSHVMEHIRNTLPMMQDCWRIAKPKAKMTVRCPYGSSDDAWEDQTHVRAYFLQSFGYFSQPFYWRADYGYRGDWQPKIITLLIEKKFSTMSTQALMALINRERNIVREMICELEAIKPIRQALRALQAMPAINVSFI